MVAGDTGRGFELGWDRDRRSLNRNEKLAQRIDGIGTAEIMPQWLQRDGGAG